MTVRILIVDDYEDWRRTVRELLRQSPELQVICEVADGLEAVRKAGELKPDLILLDIGLPQLNGIEAARRIRQLSPNSKIIFLSQETSLDVVQVASSTGARGYVYKAEAQSDLVPAIDAALRGIQFVSSLLRGGEVPDTVGTKTPRRHAARLRWLPQRVNFKSSCRDLGKVSPRSRRRLRIWFTTAVRRITQRSRTRCRACKSNCSSVLIGTKRILGRCTASAMASASR
jgi:DNA-binding NarL/FixJ family response regulator